MFYGAACEWLFTTMCGIRVDEENHFTIAPRPSGHFTHAKASYQSVFGHVESGWQQAAGGNRIRDYGSRQLHCGTLLSLRTTAAAHRRHMAV